MVPFSFGCGSAVFAAIATLAPSRAARSAIASPMPRLPPEMNSVLPLSVVMAQNSVLISAFEFQKARTTGLPSWQQSGVGVQNPAAGFRQREGRDEEQSIGHHREDRDGVAERRRGRERADQEREQRADAAAEIIAEPLSGSAQSRRIKLGQESAHAREVARCEEAERKPQQPQHLVGQRQLRIDDDDGDSTDGKCQEQVAPPY